LKVSPVTGKINGEKSTQARNRFQMSAIKLIDQDHRPSDQRALVKLFGVRKTRPTAQR
jgi:hypothetical protein